MIKPLTETDLASIKSSFVTRRVAAGVIRGLDPAPQTLAPGDLVVAEITEIGQHARLETPCGRRAILHSGDRALLACGARYAPDQFEATAPTEAGPAHLAAAGGIAGVVIHAHDRMKPATAIRILGAATGDLGRRLNLRDFALTHAPGGAEPPAIAVVGTAMNSGKTHAVSSLVRGLRAAGRKVAALKITGTGAGGDIWRQLDAGAHLALDFTDVGFATTYRADPAAIEQGAYALLAAAAEAGAEAAVIEIADGLRQRETAALLASPRFRARLGGLVFAASDGLGAERGALELERLGHRVLAVSGVLTRSPLLMREAAAAVAPPILTAKALADPATAVALSVGRNLVGRGSARIPAVPSTPRSEEAIADVA